MVWDVKTLDEIAEENEAIVFDTGALIGNLNNAELSQSHYANIQRLVDNGIRLNVSQGVKREVNGFRNSFSIPRFPLEVHRSKYFERISPKIVEYFLPKAAELGITKGRLDYKSTDLNIAALAFVFACNKPSVAFLSSDRKLNYLVYSTMDDLNGFPCDIEGIVNVYAFSLSRAEFISYKEELNLTERRKAR